MNKPQYIYLLQEREFIKLNEPVYKIGKTTQPNHKRFKQYPNYSSLLLQSICSDCNSIEKELIHSFKTKFKQRVDIGREYFEGNYLDMIVVINKIIQNYTIQQYIPIIEPIEINEEISNLYNNFITTYIRYDLDSKVNRTKLYELFQDWWYLHEHTKVPKQKYVEDKMIELFINKDITKGDYSWKGISIINDDSE